MPVTPEDLSIPRASLGVSANIEEAVNPALERIATIMTPQDQGPMSTLPAATEARRGMIYHATSPIDMILRCDGTRWHAIVEHLVGSVLDWPAAVAPPTFDGLVTWLEMQGQSYPASNYPKLAAAWGITGGTIQIPDRRGRSPMGAGSRQGKPNRVVGDEVGDDSYKIRKEELPNYQLSVYDPGHAHPYDRPAGRTADFGNDPDHARYTGAGNSTASAYTGISVSLGGGGLPLSLIHPVKVTRYFVRAA